MQGCDTVCRAVKDKRAALPSIRVGLAGLGKPVPVYTDSTLVNFKVTELAAFSLAACVPAMFSLECQSAGLHLRLP